MTNYKKELQALARGVKLSDEAEKALRILLRYCDREENYPPSFGHEHVELMQDLAILLNHRNIHHVDFYTQISSGNHDSINF